MEKNRWFMKGSMTIETAYIMPLVLMVFFFSMIGIFYYHDKNVISACAYEAAVAASTKARDKDEAEISMAEALFGERIRGKCILFGWAKADIFADEEEIRVEAFAFKGALSVAVSHAAAITKPEHYIRNIRKWNP